MILSLFLPSLNVSNYHIADSIMEKDYYELCVFSPSSGELEMNFLVPIGNRFPSFEMARDYFYDHRKCFAENVLYTVIHHH